MASFLKPIATIDRMILGLGSVMHWFVVQKKEFLFTKVNYVMK